MMSLVEEMRLFLRQVCGAVGMSGASANVVSVVVLGIALNVAALSMVRNVRGKAQPTCARTSLRSAARTELKVARTLVNSTLRKINGGQRRWCVARCGGERLHRAIESFASGSRAAV